MASSFAFAASSAAWAAATESGLAVPVSASLAWAVVRLAWAIVISCPVAPTSVSDHEGRDQGRDEPAEIQPRTTAGPGKCECSHWTFPFFPRLLRRRGDKGELELSGIGNTGDKRHARDADAPVREANRRAGRA